MARELVFGVHTVLEILRRGARACDELLVARSPKDPAVRPILALARERGTPVRMVSRDEVERRLPGKTHQAVALVVEELVTLSLAEALSTIAVDESTIWLGLDQVTDPTNFGAILRNAACFGASAVLVTERRSAKPTPVVQKIASGAAEYVRVIEEGNLNQAIQKLKKEGFWIYGAAVEGNPLGETRFNGPVFLLIGAEGKGIRRKTRDHADELVAIPQVPGAVASLNAASASAVLLYEVRSQARQKRTNRDI